MLMQKTLSTLLLLALAGAAALAAPAADPPKPAVTLYDGKAGPTAPTVASWGGGSGQDSAETFLFGGHSMKVTTLDGYQGARITFPTPVSLAGDNRVFQLTLHRGGATLHYDPRTVGLPTFGGQPGGGGFGRGGGRGGFGGGRGGARGGGRGGNGRFGGARRNPDGTPVAEPPLIPDISKLRLQFVLADGRQADVLRPIPTSSDATAGEGWYSVNVPIAALKFSGGGDPLLKSVTVGGDHYGVFFVGRLKLGTTASALAVTLDGPETVAPGQPVTLRVKGDTGLSTLKYDWDLGEGQNNAPAPTGPEATARYFDRGQDHTVTVTVTDVDGLSKPVTVTKTVHVN